MNNIFYWFDRNGPKLVGIMVGTCLSVVLACGTLFVVSRTVIYFMGLGS